MTRPALEAALAYCQLGWPVIPIWPIRNGQCACGKTDCRSPGKHPVGFLTPEGLKEATLDEELIQGWFEQIPDMNIAVRTGVEYGFLAIDVDPKNGGTVESLGELPRTAMAQTGSGGRHILFRQTIPLRSGTDKLGDGIDIRADGGYIVVAPSNHISGGTYKWLIDPRGGISELPLSIAQKLTPPNRPASALRPDSERTEGSILLARNCLSVLDPNVWDSYDEWLRIGMACKRTGLGLEEWDRWSAGCTAKYEEGACQEKWDSFSEDFANPVTTGTLVALVAQQQACSIDVVMKELGPRRKAPELRPDEIAQADAEAARQSAAAPEPEVSEQESAAPEAPQNSSILLERLNAIRDGQWNDIAWPWRRLSQLGRALVPQNVCVFCGPSGGAKSFYTMYAFLYWLNAGVDFVYLDLEEDLTYNLHRALSLLESNGNLLDEDWIRENPDDYEDAYERHMNTLDRLIPRIYQPPPQEITTAWVCKWVKKQVEAGRRLVIVDPITVAAQSNKPWIDDQKLVNTLKLLMRQSKSSIILVTHPKKGATGHSLDDLAGGAAYQRLAQAIFWLEAHGREGKDVKVASPAGTFEANIHHTIHIMKTRKGQGREASLAFRTDWSTMTFTELGIILKDKPKKRRSDE